jgi:hypothetical protein
VAFGLNPRRFDGWKILELNFKMGTTGLVVASFLGSQALPS